MLWHLAQTPRGLSYLLERWIRKLHPRNKSSKYAPTESFWGVIKSPLLLATGSYALALGRDTKPGHHVLVRLDSLGWCIFWAFIPRLWFPYSSFQQVRQPSIPSPMEEDTPKIQDTIGTVFIQGPSIVLPVLRSIIFNGSFLRTCGFLIHLSNRSDSPRFRGPWKKIRQKYGTQQEPSIFNGHPFSY